MAIPPSNDLAADQIKLGEAIEAIGADVIGIQEVDEQLARSGGASQTAVVADGKMTGHSEFFDADGVGTHEHIIGGQSTQIAHKKGVGKRRVDGGNVFRHLRFHGGFIGLD